MGLLMASLKERIFISVWTAYTAGCEKCQPEKKGEVILVAGVGNETGNRMNCLRFLASTLILDSNS
jgi:hypothetical protein